MKDNQMKAKHSMGGAVKALIAAGAVAFACAAQAATYKDAKGITWTYSVLGDGTASIESGSTGVAAVSPEPTGAVTIPPKVNGITVTRIGTFALCNCYNMTSVTIPKTVTVIGAYAFQSCTSLPSVTIPYGVTTIGIRAFRYCSSMKVAYVPKPLEGKLDATVFQNTHADFTIKYYENAAVLTLKPNNAKYGTVSGGGEYTPGNTVTLTAKAKKGKAFAGWFADSACTEKLSPSGYDYRQATVKVVMPSADTTYYAKFVTKAAAKKALKFDAATKKLAKTATKVTAGNSLALSIGFSAAAYPTITVKGLPKGLTFNKATGTISGTPTEPGSFSATVTVKDAAGNKITQKVKISVQVTSWAKGDYYGQTYLDEFEEEVAYLKFSVNATGKVSGKVTRKGKSHSFTAQCSSSTSTKTVFTPKIKISKKLTLVPGAISIEKASIGASTIVRGKNADASFYGQQTANLIDVGKPLEALIGAKLEFDSDEAGLPKGKDKLKVSIGKGDTAKVTGRINGKTISAISVPVLLTKNVKNQVYTLSINIIKSKYYGILNLGVIVSGDNVKVIPEFDI